MNPEEIQAKFEIRTQQYREDFRKYGHSAYALDYPSDRRTIRYYELVKNFDFMKRGAGKQPFVLCDAGCGFGDINAYLRLLDIGDYAYIGLDVVDEFLQKGRELYGGSGAVAYQKRNFITEDLSDLEFDYAVSCATFNNPYTEKTDNYEVIFQSIRKLYGRCKKGVSFNFFIDKVQFMRPNTAYHDPARILEFAYTLSNNVIFDNSYFPYEATMTILKENTVEENGSIFDRFIRLHRQEFEAGIFHFDPK